MRSLSAAGLVCLLRRVDDITSISTAETQAWTSAAWNGISETRGLKAALQGTMQWSDETGSQVCLCSSLDSLVIRQVSLMTLHERQVHSRCPGVRALERLVLCNTSACQGAGLL